MSFINKEQLLEGLKSKKFCKFCVYAGRGAKCFYPNEAGCSPAAMESAIIQYINSLEEKLEENNYRHEKQYTNDLLQMNYIAVMQKALSEAINKTPEQAKEELIKMGILNADGTAKETIVDV